MLYYPPFDPQLINIPDAVQDIRRYPTFRYIICFDARNNHAISASNSNEVYHTQMEDDLSGRGYFFQLSRGYFDYSDKTFRHSYISEDSPDILVSSIEAAVRRAIDNLISNIDKT